MLPNRHFICVVLQFWAGALTAALACLNQYELPWNRERPPTVLQQLKTPSGKESWSDREKRLRKQLAKRDDYQIKNDLGVALAHIGRAVEAAEIFEQIEAENPGLYQTASNLGTAYELAGENEKAIEWIRKGIERNPASHEGTEWLHVRILEAKIALAADPGWLESNSVSGFSANSDENAPPPLGNRGEKLSTTEVKTALLYQLRERLQFVRPPNAIVGALLLDLADMASEDSNERDGGAGVYKLAVDYLDAAPHADSLRSEATARWQSALAKAKAESSALHRQYIFGLDLFVVLIFGGLVLGIVAIGALRWVVQRSTW